jgi:ABC-2 type transport system permease protein
MTGGAENHLLSWRRLRALIRKEFLEIVRDPSTIIIAGILPLVLMFLYGYGITFDARNIRIGLVAEVSTAETSSFEAALKNSTLFEITSAYDRRDLQAGLVSGDFDGIVVLDEDFSARAVRGEKVPVQLIVDGSNANKANLVIAHLQGAWTNWLQQEAAERGTDVKAPISIEPRYWFNPDVLSHHYLVPSSLAMIMTLIGALLTAMVVAREWERGTMEALLATPVGVIDLVLGKLIPYFVLGMLSMALSTVLAIFVFGVPFRGSVLALTIVSAIFMWAALGQGLLISTVARSQLVAGQAALVSAYLPAVFFSGFIYETESMPWPLPLVSYVVPARYFISSLQTLFLAGDQLSVLVPNSLVIGAIAVGFFALTAKLTKRRLE